MTVDIAIVRPSVATVLARPPTDAVVLSSLLGLLAALAALAELVVLLSLAELLPAAGFRSASTLALFVSPGIPSVTPGLSTALAAVPVLRLRRVAVLVRTAAPATLLGVAGPFVTGAAPAVLVARPTGALLVTHPIVSLLVAHPIAPLLVAHPIAPLLVSVLPGLDAMLIGSTAVMAFRSTVLSGAAPVPIAASLL